MEKFQDILVQGHVLEPGKRVKFQDRSSPRTLQQDEVIRGGIRNCRLALVELRDVGLR